MANAIVTLDGSALTFLDGLGGLILPMATIPTFPTLKGLAWPVGRAPLQSTLKQKAISGKETRLQLYSFGLYKYELTFSYLGSGAQNQDWQLLMSFFQLVAGAALPFHFNDVYDNAIAGQVLGTGDGATRSFNFARTLSLITEPAQDVTADATILSASDEHEQRMAQPWEPRTRLMVATEGAQGGRWWGESEGRWPAAPLPGEPRDSYGCGDSFAAGFTFGLASGMAPAQAAEVGARCGARMLTRVGAP